DLGCSDEDLDLDDEDMLKQIAAKRISGRLVMIGLGIHCSWRTPKGPALIVVGTDTEEAEEDAKEDTCSENQDSKEAAPVDAEEVVHDPGWARVFRRGNAGAP
ncbi:hypothetical protein BGX31_009988, partial [Mortierella sp. GBA43]